MNDDALRSRLRQLRVPGPDDATVSDALDHALDALRDRGVSNLKAGCASRDRWSWRDWLWPSPVAWAAMAAVWILVLGREFLTRPTSPQANAAMAAANDRPPDRANQAALRYAVYQAEWRELEKILHAE
jgi:hypothetical protein